MKLSAADKKRIQHQFDSLSRRAMRGEASDYSRETSRKSNHETNFSDLSLHQMNSLFVEDDYPSEKYFYEVQGFDVEVRSELISVSLDALPTHKREIILLSYFLDMSDADIARLLKNDRSTIHYHRTSALSMLKNLMKEKPTDES